MSQEKIKIDTSLIPDAEAHALGRTLLRLFSEWAEDPEVMRDFEAWKERGEHKKYKL